MEVFFVRSWRPVAVRGLAALLFGLCALFWPSVTLAGLILLFGAYALVDGVLAISAATHQRAPRHAWSLAVEGLVGVAIGLAAVFWTGATVVVILRLVAVWALLTGVLELAIAARLRGRVPGISLLALAGAISLVLGGLMLWWPTVSALVMTMLLGGYALLFGAVLLALAARMRRSARKDKRASHDLGPTAHAQ